MKEPSNAFGLAAGLPAVEALHAAWLFDLDGTLYPLRPVQLAMACELAVCSPHWLPALSRFRREQERQRHESRAEGASPYRRQLERAAAAGGLTIDALEGAVERWMQHRPGKWLRIFRRRSLIAEIAAFRNQGGRTAVVSDYPALSKLRAMRLTELFDVVVANGEAGGPLSLKPSPEGFLLAAERLAVAPRECLVIGDRDEADGDAARRAGMSFLHVRAFRGRSNAANLK